MFISPINIKVLCVFNDLGDPTIGAMGLGWGALGMMPGTTTHELIGSGLRV